MRSAANSPCCAVLVDAPPVPGIDPGRWQEISRFQRAVYRALCGVPRGQVVTYAALARAIGCNSPRAVGQALRRNPFAPVVPCHRVVASGLRLGGFNGATVGADLARKRQLLAEEGVPFAADDRLAGTVRLCILPVCPAGPLPSAEGRGTAGTVGADF